MTRKEAARLLGVGPQAGGNEVHRAFRRNSLKAHPDSGGSHEAFLAIAEARDTLLAPVVAEPEPSYSPPTYAYREPSYSYSYTPHRPRFTFPSIPWSYVLGGLAAYAAVWLLGGVDWSSLWVSATAQIYNLPPEAIPLAIGAVLLLMGGVRPQAVFWIVLVGGFLWSTFSGDFSVLGSQLANQLAYIQTLGGAGT